MRLLLLLLVFSLVSFSHPAVSGDLSELQRPFQESKLRILDELMSQECPGYVKQKNFKEPTGMDLAALEELLQQQTERFMSCRDRKLQPTVTSTTSAEQNTINLATSCPSSDGDSVLNIQLISYNSTTNKKASGQLCNPDGSPCNIILEICVSPINSTVCKFSQRVTEIAGYNLGNASNPVTVSLGSERWQDAQLHVKVLEKGAVDDLVTSDEVDTFRYNLADLHGNFQKPLTLYGGRSADKTELQMRLTVVCPSPSTLSSSATAAPSPLPPECLTATNLTQSWRLEHHGKNTKGGGLHSYTGYACDLHEGLGWFRFAGAAGSHMLDKCPKYKSCGARYPYYMSDTPPQSVGVTANITVYTISHGKCGAGKLPVLAMRCSLITDHDLIYKYVGNYHTGPCRHAFCGMN